MKNLIGFVLVTLLILGASSMLFAEVKAKPTVTLVVAPKNGSKPKEYQADAHAAEGLVKETKDNNSAVSVSE